MKQFSLLLVSLILMSSSFADAELATRLHRSFNSALHPENQLKLDRARELTIVYGGADIAKHSPLVSRTLVG